MKVSDIPFADHIGIEADNDTLVLEPDSSLQNHLQTLHAGAQYTLAETQSGIYLQQLFPELLGKVIPLLRESQIKYKKPVTTTLRAQASCSDMALEDFKNRLDKKGRALIEIEVVLVDPEKSVVAQGRFNWFVQRL